MVMRAIRHQDSVFWEAIVVTLFIFGCGLLLGVYIENTRLESVSDAYTQAENSLLDIRAQTELFSTNIDCDVAIRRNIEFGDSIYKEALELEKYEASRQLTNNLISKHKQFATLRVIFLVNSMRIQERCGNKFDIVTYFYQYAPESMEIKTTQSVFASALFDLKQEYGSGIILIPIVSDLNVSSVEILKENYKINDSAILINNDTVLYSLDDLSRIRDYLSSN